MTIEFKQTIPILRIFDVQKAKDFYAGFLGFSVDWEHHFDDESPAYMQISRDGMTLHLSEHHGDCCPGSTVFVWMKGIDDFHKEITSKGYKYLRPGIEKTFYDSKCVEVIDPFGNRIRFNEKLNIEKLVNVTVYYLEMFAPSRRTVPSPRAGLTVLHVQTPSVPYYRFLYNAVGQDYHWLSRRKLSDEALAAVIQDSRNELHVLHVDGSPAGFAELERRSADEIELVQFGLMSGFIGHGLGTWLLQWTIDKVWSYEPKRFWLHTCTLDHPAALPTYEKAGFARYKTEVIRREL